MIVRTTIKTEKEINEIYDKKKVLAFLRYHHLIFAYYFIWKIMMVVKTSYKKKTNTKISKEIKSKKSKRLFKHIYAVYTRLERGVIVLSRIIL